MGEQPGGQRHITWDYEDSVIGYYQIWPATGEGEGVLDGGVVLDVPQTPENDARVKQIVALIEEMC